MKNVGASIGKAEPFRSVLRRRRKPRFATPCAPKLRRRIIVHVAAAAAATVGVRIGGRLAFLIADSQDAAIVIFIDAIEPAALQRIIDEGNVIFVVRKNPARAESIADQRSRIFLFDRW